jgi:hypothetical protein
MKSISEQMRGRKSISPPEKYSKGSMPRSCPHARVLRPAGKDGEEVGLQRELAKEPKSSLPTTRSRPFTKTTTSS